jgi:hypothetical protein
VVGADDTVTVAGSNARTGGLFVARWDAGGAQRFVTLLEHAPGVFPALGGVVVRADGSVRVASADLDQSIVHAIDADGSSTDVRAIGGPGASVSTLVAAPLDGWWAVGRDADGRVFAELHDGSDELVQFIVTDLVAIARDAEATQDGIVVLADTDASPRPKLVSVSTDGGIDEVVDTTCSGGLSLTSDELRVVAAPEWSGGEAGGPCVLAPDGTAARSPWSVPLVDGATHLGVGPSDRLVVVGWLPDATIVVQSQLADGGAGWSSEHTTDRAYLLPFGVATGQSGRIAVPTVTQDATGTATGTVFVFAP